MRDSRTMRSGRYTPEEVTVLVEEWATLRYNRRPSIRVRLMDLERSIPRLTLPLRQAVVLHGQLGFSQRVVADLVGCSQPTVLRRYANGLEQLMTLMNGG